MEIFVCACHFLYVEGRYLREMTDVTKSPVYDNSPRASSTSSYDQSGKEHGKSSLDRDEEKTNEREDVEGRVPHYVVARNGLDITIWDATARGSFLGELDDCHCPHLPSPESLRDFDMTCYGDVSTSSSHVNLLDVFRRIGSENERGNFDYSGVGCLVCNSVKNSWLCLHCRRVFCGRNQGKHMIEHYKATKHGVVMSFETLQFWCYDCENDRSVGIEMDGLIEHGPNGFTNFNPHLHTFYKFMQDLKFPGQKPSHKTCRPAPRSPLFRAEKRVKLDRQNSLAFRGSAEADATTDVVFDASTFDPERAAQWTPDSPMKRGAIPP